jgi:hypothetical protein
MIASSCCRSCRTTGTGPAAPAALLRRPWFPDDGAIVDYSGRLKTLSLVPDTRRESALLSCPEYTVSLNVIVRCDISDPRLNRFPAEGLGHERRQLCPLAVQHRHRVAQL